MTVAQLIKQLEQFDSNTPVIGHDVSVTKDLEFSDVVSAVCLCEEMPEEGVSR